MGEWSIDKAKALYNLPHWSGGYFSVNGLGHVTAHPSRDSTLGIDLYDLVAQARQQGLRLPLLVRFNGILRDRVAHLTRSFREAIDSEHYDGKYTAVYPIKVNQQRHVIEELLRGGDGNLGLEAGSKPELMAVLGMAPPGSVIVCNGYKDREYIRLALIGKAMGHRVYIVVEKRSELELILAESRLLDIEPMLGLRVRLASIGTGKWQNSGGEKSKFGLSSSQVLQAIEQLRAQQMLHCLTLLHCHLGSQLANIRDIQRGMGELSRYYVELRHLGVDLRVVDVGGGLGVDYEGTRSRSDCSVNYTLREYANNIVYALKESCREAGVPHPEIFSESGRAVTAHHAVLITNVVDVEQVRRYEEIPPPGVDESPLLHSLWDGLASLRRPLPERSVIEIYHDAMHWMGEAHGMYMHGVLTLEQRAHAEEIYHATCWEVVSRLPVTARAYREVLDDLSERLADKYFCNFSLFQSLPDVWAIDQIFPVMPIQRLDEIPERRVVLEDITCDSDGRIERYVEESGLTSTLPLHDFRRDEEYLLGIFLIGAYQEILGDLHNLFGDSDSVSVEVSSDGTYQLQAIRQGDSVADVLHSVQLDSRQLLDSYRDKLKRSGLTVEQQQIFYEQLQLGIEGYTYLEG